MGSMQCNVEFATKLATFNATEYGSTVQVSFPPVFCRPCCLENREYSRRDSSCLPHGTLYPQKLPLTSPTSGGRSVSLVRSRTQTTEFVLFFVL
jgi:hypothetical protein